jgi:hypothetical protein
MVAIGPVAILLLVLVVAVVATIGSSAFKSQEEAKPRGFPWLLMTFGVVVVAGIITFILYQARPVTYVLDVTVPSGKGFIGEVIIDGRREIITGVGNKRFEFTGKTLRWRVLIDDASGAESISVQVTGGVGGSSSSAWGARGFAEKQFIGGGGMFTSMNEDEWRMLMPQLKPETDDTLLQGAAAPSNPVQDESSDDATPEPESDASQGTDDGVEPSALHSRHGLLPIAHA